MAKLSKYVLISFALISCGRIDNVKNRESIKLKGEWYSETIFDGMTNQTFYMNFSDMRAEIQMLDFYNNRYSLKDSLIQVDVENEDHFDMKVIYCDSNRLGLAILEDTYLQFESNQKRQWKDVTTHSMLAKISKLDTIWLHKANKRNGEELKQIWFRTSDADNKGNCVYVRLDFPSEKITLFRIDDDEYKGFKGVLSNNEIKRIKEKFQYLILDTNEKKYITNTSGSEDNVLIIDTRSGLNRYRIIGRNESPPEFQSLINTIIEVSNNNTSLKYNSQITLSFFEELGVPYLTEEHD